jgi:hypothetical protein
MPNLFVQQESVDYHGFFSAPAYELMGEGGKIMAGLAKTFSSHNVGLGNFRTEVDINDPSTNAIVVYLGRFGIYRFKFDQVQASLKQFSDDDLEGMINVIQKGDAWLHETIPSLAFRRHAFVYSSHSVLSEGTSQSFLLSLPRRPTPVLGRDLGSGIIENWYDENMDARVYLTLTHSFTETDGIYINYMLTFERETIDYAETASKARGLLDAALESLGLQFAEPPQS